MRTLYALYFSTSGLCVSGDFTYY